MSWEQGLVDLSLFSYAPNDERNSFLAGSDCRHEDIVDDSPQVAREQPRQRRNQQEGERNIARKALPPPLSPPSSRFCAPVPAPHEFDSDTVSPRTKRKRTQQSPSTPSNSLQQRRHTALAPALTLSVPQSNPANQASPTAMVWMPEEQIWIAIGEDEQGHYPSPDEYPTPPAYSPPRPRNYSRSAPTTRVTSRWDMTPPLTPIQTQLQSLILPREEERDEERLSPLFQEAMNSVPMVDTFDPPPPPTYEGTVRGTRMCTSMSENSSARAASTNTPHIISQLSSRYQTNSQSKSRQRAVTDGQQPRLAVDTSNTGGNSARLKAQEWQRDLPVKMRSWHGLAKKLVRPKSTS